MADYFPTFSNTIKRFQDKAADEKGRNVPIHGSSLYTLSLKSVPTGLNKTRTSSLFVAVRVQTPFQWQCALQTPPEHGFLAACVVLALASGTVLIYGDP